MTCRSPYQARMASERIEREQVSSGRLAPRRGTRAMRHLLDMAGRIAARGRLARMFGWPFQRVPYPGLVRP